MCLAAIAVARSIAMLMRPVVLAIGDLLVLLVFAAVVAGVIGRLSRRAIIRADPIEIVRFDRAHYTWQAICRHRSIAGLCGSRGIGSIPRSAGSIASLSVAGILLGLTKLIWETYCQSEDVNCICI